MPQLTALPNITLGENPNKSLEGIKTPICCFSRPRESRENPNKSLEGIKTIRTKSVKTVILS